MDKQSFVEELFSDSGPVDSQALVVAIKPFIRIQRSTNQIFLTEKGNEVNLAEKILLYALSKKLLKEEGYIEDDSICAKEVSEQLSLKKGSVDPTFKLLKSKGLIMGLGTDYTIPNDKLIKLENQFKKKEE